MAEIAGDELVIAYGATVEHVSLTTGKTLGKLWTPGRTLAVFGTKTRRVAVLQGEAARGQIWDVSATARSVGSTAIAASGRRRFSGRAPS